MSTAPFEPPVRHPAHIRQVPYSGHIKPFGISSPAKYLGHNARQGDKASIILSLKFCAGSGLFEARQQL